MAQIGDVCGVTQLRIADEPVLREAAQRGGVGSIEAGIKRDCSRGFSDRVNGYCLLYVRGAIPNAVAAVSKRDERNSGKPVAGRRGRIERRELTALARRRRPCRRVN